MKSIFPMSCEISPHSSTSPSAGWNSRPTKLRQSSSPPWSQAESNPETPNSFQENRPQRCYPRSLAKTSSITGFQWIAPPNIGRLVPRLFQMVSKQILQRVSGCRAIAYTHLEILSLSWGSRRKDRRTDRRTVANPKQADLFQRTSQAPKKTAVRLERCSRSLDQLLWAGLCSSSESTSGNLIRHCQNLGLHHRRPAQLKF